MRQYDKVFDALYVNLSEAGETGGILDTILQAPLRLYREKRQTEARCKIRDGVSIAVLSVAASVIVLLLWKVVPIFTPYSLALEWRSHCHANRHCPEQLCRKHIRTSDLRRRGRWHHRAESMVWDARGTNGHRPHDP